MKRTNIANPLREIRGFSLVELMIVVVIFGILAAMAIPRFMRTSTKTKQAEAMAILKQIYTMQLAYRQEYDVYFLTAAVASASNPLAFVALGLGVEVTATARYSYSISSTDGGATNFTATATCGILDEDATVDTWTINENGILSVVSNDALN